MSRVLIFRRPGPGSAEPAQTPTHADVGVYQRKSAYISVPIPHSPTVGLFCPQQDLGDFNDLPGMDRHEDDAIPADAFAVSPFPIFSPERFHVTPKRIFAHLAEVGKDQLLAVWGESLKLPCGFFCEPDGPGHVRVVPE